MPKRKQELIDEEEDDAYSKQTKYKESNRKARMRQREETGREQPSKASAKGSKDNTTKDSNYC